MLLPVGVGYLSDSIFVFHSGPITDLFHKIPSFVLGPLCGHGAQMKFIRHHLWFDYPPPFSVVKDYLDGWVIDVLWALIVSPDKDKPRVGDYPLDPAAPVDWVCRALSC